MNENRSASVEAVKALGEALLQDQETKDVQDLEVFERYTHLLRSKIHHQGADFPHRLAKGYIAILEELDSSKT